MPYRGGQPAITDVLGGHVPLVMVNALEALPHIQSGALKGLAVTGPERHPLLPDVPTVAESGYPGFEALTWWALFAPAPTPRETVEELTGPSTDGLAFFTSVLRAVVTA